MDQQTTTTQDFDTKYRQAVSQRTPWILFLVIISWSLLLPTPTPSFPLALTGPAFLPSALAMC